VQDIVASTTTTSSQSSSTSVSKPPHFEMDILIEGQVVAQMAEAFANNKDGVSIRI